MMTVATRKKIAWAALALGLGSVAIFMVVTVRHGPPEGHEMIPVYSWVAAGAVASIVSIIKLKQFYKIEPADWRGFWHLTLGDAFIATVFSGLCMALWRAVWPQSFLFWGATLGVVAGVAFAFSLMAAARRGHSRAAKKFPMALGIMLSYYGWFALGGLVALTLLLVVLGGLQGTLEMLRDLLFEGESRLGLSYSIRAGLVALPVGLILKHSMEGK